MKKRARDIEDQCEQSGAKLIMLNNPTTLLKMIYTMY
jgi:hypothetical protein